jgi:hypothetical protein
VRPPLLSALVAVDAGATLTATAASAAGRGARILPRNTIQCPAFEKLPDGTWHVSEATFRIGNFKKMVFTNLTIGPHFFTFAGTDLYSVLQRKCGSHALARTR